MLLWCGMNSSLLIFSILAGCFVSHSYKAVTFAWQQARIFKKNANPKVKFALQKNYFLDFTFYRFLIVLWFTDRTHGSDVGTVVW